MRTIATLILNYNDSGTTIGLVESIKDYKCLNWIVVVDNHSTDNSLVELNELQLKKVIVLSAERNAGYGAGNNIGIRYIYDVLHAEYFLLMNPDVEISESCIMHMMDIISEDDSCVMISPIQRLQSKDGIIVRNWKLPSVFESVISSNMLLSAIINPIKYYQISDTNENETTQVDVIQGALFLADSKFFRYNALYDEKMFLYNEEIYIAKKILDKHKYGLQLNEEFYIHRHSVTIKKSFKSSLTIRRLQLDSRYYFLTANYKISCAGKIVIKIFFLLCEAEMAAYIPIRKLLRKK